KAGFDRGHVSRAGRSGAGNCESGRRSAMRFDRDDCTRPSASWRFAPREYDQRSAAQSAGTRATRARGEVGVAALVTGALFVIPSEVEESLTISVCDA